VCYIVSEMDKRIGRRVVVAADTKQRVSLGVWRTVMGLYGRRCEERANVSP
jgi:hypothetical protein